jgi:hypothetical protein
LPSSSNNYSETRKKSKDKLLNKGPVAALADKLSSSKAETKEVEKQGSFCLLEGLTQIPSNIL